MADEQTLLQQIQTLQEADTKAHRPFAESPAKSTSISLRVDPGQLVDQVYKMRLAGVDEKTIRAAFEQAIEQVQGTPRKTHNSMKAHRDAPKMPSPEEINQIYVKRYAHGIDDNEIQNETVQGIVTAIKASNEARKALPPKPSLRVRAVQYCVRKVLQACIFLCKVAGVK